MRIGFINCYVNVKFFDTFFMKTSKIPVFQIEEDDRLPKVLCYRCMYNLENFYDFRTACVNAAAWLERNRPKEGVSVLDPISERT